MLPADPVNNPTDQRKGPKKQLAIEGGHKVISNDSEMDEHKLTHKNDETNTEETIDKRDSHPIAPLPLHRNIMSSNYTLPDPLEHSQNLTMADRFHYGRMSGSGDKPAEKPAGFSVPFTDQQYEVAVLSLNQLLENVDNEQKKNIDSNPSKYLAVVPYGVGLGWAHDFPSAAQAILDFLRAQPAKSKRDGYFDPPITLFIINFTRAHRDWLLWKQVFPLNMPGATFTVYPLDKEQPNWYYMQLSGDTVMEGKDAKKVEALSVIKKKMWGNNKIHKTVRNFMAGHPEANLTKRLISAIQATINATESFHLAYVEPDKHCDYK
ncbi:hypothetical protein BT96DRAFT_1005895 [Gymnopus androsaceus JB14]|uniref:Uncharacterized protein n=1 Tax=Gymnopus androsaceus JB14 TaxID=1447944 RepID=A0A6A4GMX4_9AGAR|nr:hypothetical protein BT96DRAFT_1005895 [Gymnopus androsaceus JB14]